MLKIMMPRQKFRLGSSTMLLIYCATVVAVGRLEFLFRLFFRLFPAGGDLMWRLAYNLKACIAIGAFISLGFLVYSLSRKEVQYQFIIEIAIAVSLYALV